MASPMPGCSAFPVLPLFTFWQARDKFKIDRAAARRCDRARGSGEPGDGAAVLFVGRGLLLRAVATPCT